MGAVWEGSPCTSQQSQLKNPHQTKPIENFSTIVLLVPMTLGHLESLTTAPASRSGPVATARISLPITLLAVLLVLMDYGLFQLWLQHFRAHLFPSFSEIHILYSSGNTLAQFSGRPTPTPFSLMKQPISWINSGEVLEQEFLCPMTWYLRVPLAAQGPSTELTATCVDG